METTAAIPWSAGEMAVFAGDGLHARICGNGDHAGASPGQAGVVYAVPPGDDQRKALTSAGSRPRRPTVEPGAIPTLINPSSYPSKCKRAGPDHTQLEEGGDVVETETAGAASPTQRKTTHP